MNDQSRVNTIFDEEGTPIGVAVKWNETIASPAECIVQYYDGSASSEYFSELNFNDTDKAREYLNSKEP